ncbi:MAG: glycosyltransferase [Phycisphaerae bacterium]|nr:glycosyltransferase [Phycisphaerae bacterium]
MNMRRALIVAYDFPPAGGSGVQRALKLAKYLPRAGWQPTLLCAGHDRQTLRDDSLLRDVPAGVHVERVLGLEPAGVARWLGATLGGDRPEFEPIERRIYWRLHRAVEFAGLPEIPLLWSLAACHVAPQLARRHGIDAVITTGPPHSVHLVGRVLQRRLGLPWIADLRDPITTNFAYRPASRVADGFWRRMETMIARRADRIITTCDDFADDFAARHRLNATRCATITNGYDADDFASPPPPIRPGFVLSYVGAFYREQTIEPILCGIRRLLAERPALLGQFVFEHVGSVSREQSRFIFPSDSGFYHPRGYRTHADAVAAMRSAAALLLVVPSNAGGRLCIPAKTFEYLAAERPIVALVHSNSALERLLTAAGHVVIGHGYHRDRAVEALRTAVDRWSELRGPLRRPAEFLRGVRRDVLAARYAEQLNLAVGHGRTELSRPAVPQLRIAAA